MAAASFAVLGLVFVIASGAAGETAADLTHLTDMRIQDQELAQAVDDEEAGLDDYVLSGDPTALRRFDESVALEAGLVARLREDAAEMPRYLSGLDAMVAASLAWQNEVAAPAIAAVAADDQVALARFVAQSTGDHLAVESAVDIAR